jgi:hypothetical protein
MLLLAIAIMAIQGAWFEIIFFVIAVIGTRGGFWQLLTILAAIGLAVFRGPDAVFPFLVGILFVDVAFLLRWFGGGDTQVAFAMIAISRDWEMLGLLAVATIIAWLFLSLRKGNVRHLAKRTAYVAKHLSSPVEDDPDSIRSPWVVTASFAGLFYIFIYPGVIGFL